MSTEVSAYFDQVQSLFDQLLLLGALLFGFSFAVVVQLSVSKDASVHTRIRRLYFAALLLFVNATGSALILITRTRNALLNYALPMAAPGDADRAALATLDAPWVSFLLTSLVASLVAGVVLWMAGMVALARKDSRGFALLVLVAVAFILAVFFVGFTQLGA